MGYVVVWDCLWVFFFVMLEEDDFILFLFWIFYLKLEKFIFMSKFYVVGKGGDFELLVIWCKYSFVFNVIC